MCFQTKYTMSTSIPFSVVAVSLRAVVLIGVVDIAANVSALNVVGFLGIGVAVLLCESVDVEVVTRVVFDE